MPEVTQAMMDYANFMERYVEPALYFLYLMSVIIGPAVTTFLNIVMGITGWFTGIGGTFQFDIAPLVENR